MDMPSTPFAQWRVDNQPDPFNNRDYADISNIAKGHITDHVEIANSLGMMISDKTVAKERIRYLSRKLYSLIEAKGLDVEPYNQQRAALVNGDLTDDQIANAFFMEDYCNYLDGARKRIIWLAECITEIESQ